MPKPDPAQHDKTFEQAAAEARAREAANEAAMSPVKPDDFARTGAGVGGYYRGLLAAGVDRTQAMALSGDFRDWLLEASIWFAPEVGATLGQSVGAYHVALGEMDPDDVLAMTREFQAWTFAKAHEAFKVAKGQGDGGAR